MPCSAIIFDLDGTLLDTVNDIGCAANQVLVESGYPPHPLSSYRQFVGSGVAVLFERALPREAIDESVVQECISRFEQAYKACWNQATVPYKGILELLDELVKRNLHLAVLSNKPDTFTKKCVEEYFFDYHLDPIYGHRPGVARKPNPEAVLEILEYHKVSAAQTIFVGDSEIDIQTAQNADVFSIGVTWGYRSSAALAAQGADLLIDKPTDLLSFITKDS